MAPPVLPRLCLLPSTPTSCSGRGMTCSPRPPKPQATLSLPPLRTPGCSASSPRARIGSSPAWRVAGERRGARSAGQSSSGRTAWWATWTGTSTTCPSSMTSSRTPILLGYLQGPCSKYK
ncbi:hypothetical protein VPH35_052837 [Triticum aestivum]